jgi:hypothetical protein
MSESLEQSTIEPEVCEISTTTIDIPVDAAGPGQEPTNVSEIDLSGYNYDLVLTYKMIEDQDDQDSLFRIQFLQAFGINDDEYHPDIVSAVIDDLYERYRENKGIREILEAHPLYRNNIRDMLHTDESTDASTDEQVLSTVNEIIATNICGNDMNDNSEMIFCMMFSFQLFDLFHMCIRHAKRNEEIPREIYDAITECFRNMF